MAEKKRSKSIRACKRCRTIITGKEEVCPVCGSTELSDEWSGVVIILREDSEITEIFGEKRPGKYAVNVK
ncbi:MAG: transcription elongation factor subunit Spt4 [Sulfolobaceae archaeon]